MKRKFWQRNSKQVGAEGKLSEVPLLPKAKQCRGDKRLNLIQRLEGDHEGDLQAHQPMCTSAPPLNLHLQQTTSSCNQSILPKCQNISLTIKQKRVSGVWENEIFPVLLRDVGSWNHI